MTDEKKPITIEFAPGCFDSFEGTQEELDGLMAEIQRMFESGEAELHAVPLDIDALIEEDPELALKIAQSLSDDDEPNPKRNLQ